MPRHHCGATQSKAFMHTHGPHARRPVLGRSVLGYAALKAKASEALNWAACKDLAKGVGFWVFWPGPRMFRGPPGGHQGHPSGFRGLPRPPEAPGTLHKPNQKVVEPKNRDLAIKRTTRGARRRNRVRGNLRDESLVHFMQVRARFCSRPPVPEISKLQKIGPASGAESGAAPSV